MSGTMTVLQAEAAYEEALRRRNEQHRYIAAARREAASRAAIVPDIEIEIARARANLELAQGRDRSEIRWPTRAEQLAARRDVEYALHAARNPADALADPSDEHAFSGDAFGLECMVGQLHTAACGKPRDEHEPDCF